MNQYNAVSKDGIPTAPEGQQVAGPKAVAPRSLLKPAQGWQCHMRETAFACEIQDIAGSMDGEKNGPVAAQEFPDQQE
jgi:hypothetical protein